MRKIFRWDNPNHGQYTYSTISQGETPLVTITRKLARQLRTVLRRAFGNIRGKGPAIGFIAGVEGLIVKSIYGDACSTSIIGLC